MNLFMMGARIPIGRNPRPTNSLFGLRISLTCDTNDISISVPSTGVASTHRRMSMPIDFFTDFHKRVAKPKDVCLGRDIKL